MMAKPIKTLELPDPVILAFNKNKSKADIRVNTLRAILCQPVTKSLLNMIGVC